MATIRAVARQNRANKEMKCKVEFAICQFRKTAYIDSGIFVSVHKVDGKNVANFANGVCTSAEPDFTKKNAAIMQMLDGYVKKLALIKNVALKNAEQIKIVLCSDGDSYHHDLLSKPTVLTVCSAGESLCRELMDDGRVNYAENVRNGIARFKEWCRGDLPLEDLSSPLLNDYQRWLRRQPAMCWKGKKNGLVPKVDADGNKVLLSEDSVTKYMQTIKTIINRNVNCGKAKYNVHPFAGVRLKKGKVKICDVSLEGWKKIVNAETLNREEKVAQDCFKLSFFMGGMNVGDICRARWDGESVTYTRKKVDGRVSQRQTLPILEQVKDIVARYIQKDGRLDFGFKVSNMNNRCAIGLKRIAKRIGVDVLDGNVCMMTARKTWAQFAGLIGVQRYVVDYCMGHVPGNEIADHYQRAMAMQASAACKAVADFVDNPDKWKPILEYRAMAAAGISQIPEKEKDCPRG